MRQTSMGSQPNSVPKSQTPVFSAKQQAFITEYLVDKNATQAAIRAGYSAKTANEQGARMLAKVSIREAIDAQLKAQEKRTLITADRVLKELFRIAMVDIKDAFNEDGSLKDVREIPAHIRRAVSSIEVDDLFDWDQGKRKKIGHTRKIKFWNKPHALELLGKHLKLFTDKIEIDASENFAEVLKKARERATSGAK